jgi:hypothetical protein
MDLLLGIAVSTHLGLSNDYNQIHPHIRIEQDDFIAGAYYNSVDNISLYAGYEYVMNDKISIEGALVTGYEYDIPIVPMVRGKYKMNDNINAFVSPTMEGDTVGLVAGIELWGF